WMDIHRRGNPWAPKSVPYLYCVGSGGQVFKNVLIRAQWVWVEPIDSIPSELIVSISAGHGHYNCSFIISNHTSGWENLKNDGCWRIDRYSGLSPTTIVVHDPYGIFTLIDIMENGRGLESNDHSAYCIFQLIFKACGPPGDRGCNGRTIVTGQNGINA